MSVVDFSKLNKLTSKSYNDQKATIKKVMQGRDVKCEICQQLLILVLPKTSKIDNNKNHRCGIFCPNNCTDIELDMS